jgi:hypothetical protein
MLQEVVLCSSVNVRRHSPPREHLDLDWSLTGHASHLSVTIHNERPVTTNDQSFIVTPERLVPSG